MKQYERDRVPTSVIAPIIERWLKRHHALHPAENKNGPGTAYIKHSSPGDGALMVLGFHCKVSARVLRRILNGRMQTGRLGQYVDYISFDTADKIVCATVGPMAWRNDETLAEHYGPLKVMHRELVGGYELPEGFDFDEISDAARSRWRRAQVAA